MPPLDLRTTDGVRLAAIHDPPEAPAPTTGPRVAVVAHPHPLEGGTKENKVVWVIARALRERGLHIVRFDFRGGGASDGTHDRGDAERLDLEAAFDHAATLESGPPLLAGFSFGSWVSARVASERGAAGLFLVAPPVTLYAYPELDGNAPPTAVVIAEDDELIPAAAIETWANSQPAVTQIDRVAGATHLFHGKLRSVAASAARFAARLT